jgi:uncharacterized protein YycO
MKKIIVFILFLAITIVVYSKQLDYSILKDGDIIFQELESDQSKAIKLATHSRYTHVGIIFKLDGRYKVVEALDPVRITELGDFIKRGISGKCVIKRLKNYNSIINKMLVEKMKNRAMSFIGKRYDIYFEWDNNKLYCSELVWKIYHDSVGIKVGKLRKLKDFDLKSPEVKRIMKKRYGNKIPYNETVISPQDIFEADNLTVVFKD